MSRLPPGPVERRRDLLALTLAALLLFTGGPASRYFGALSTSSVIRTLLGTYGGPG